MKKHNVRMTVFKQYRNGFLTNIFELNQIKFSKLSTYLNEYCHGRVFEYSTYPSGTLSMTESKVLRNSQDFRFIVYVDYM